MARKPRVHRLKRPVLPTPPRCQFTGCRPGVRPAVSLTFRSASGFVWSYATCAAHQSLCVDQMRAAQPPGELIDVRVLEGAE